MTLLERRDLCSRQMNIVLAYVMIMASIGIVLDLRSQGYFEPGTGTRYRFTFLEQHVPGHVA